MKLLLALLGAALAGALLLLLAMTLVEPTPARGDASREELLARIERLESQLGNRATATPSAGSDAAHAPAPATRDATPTGPRSPGASGGPPAAPSARWYLDQYVLSFQGGGPGAEWFRLAVEAYAAELLGDICGIVGDGAANATLRMRLAEILGSARFRGNAVAIEALLGAIRARDAEGVVKAALDGLSNIGNADTGLALELAVWSVPRGNLQQRAFGVIVRLAGTHTNQAILRLLKGAPDEATKVFLVKLLDNNDLEGALEAFRWLSAQAQPVRLRAANKIDNYRTEPFRAFVAEWLGVERDEEVRKALGAAVAKMQTGNNWSARKAVGPPDVTDPTHDHPNAWASRDADMGEQWLEVTYSPPIRASQVRIFEVCSAGAVTSISLIDAAGVSHTVWSGVDPTASPSVFEVTFTTTNYLVKRVRIVLDTNRTPNWNEIDAVELVGPDGRAWAADASASSSYGDGS